VTLMRPILPPNEDRDLADIEKEPGFATYGWMPPLCPWCGQWLRPVDFQPAGMPFAAKAGCPAYHGLFAFSQQRWVNVRPPDVQMGGDGAWWTSLTVEQLQAMALEC
jgi:hypothetical protein